MIILICLEDFVCYHVNWVCRSNDYHKTCFTVHKNLMFPATLLLLLQKGAILTHYSAYLFLELSLHFSSLLLTILITRFNQLLIKNLRIFFVFKKFRNIFKF